jgi:hypothetical protein
VNDFITTPLTYTRDQRTSRDVCRDACAIERPISPAGGHRWIVPVCIVCAIVLFFILRSQA